MKITDTSGDVWERSLREALRETDGHIGNAALLLGINRNTLGQFFLRAGIDFREYRHPRTAPEELAAARARVAEKIKAGECIRCRAPAALGRTRCQAHLNEAARQQAERGRRKKNQ